ncbi:MULTISPECIES: cation diffusion facilitator family transporter [Methanobrevibacter]|uniref:Cation diffusion facilitator family transporter n=1 Tax=Methanobrevibacter gottschalkii DSM 11977 TaxID=1122229 RepID=A0A3N5C1W4_9EURY|nr:MULTISPECIES: cation diffusion facilitator family transporter [Methanobrevibacter]OEC97282.1 cation diffusion facilitator family transporter [Methanobrevibacter sp. A27]RPF51995.1 cation diffusion facilitator family transporter [Methanobrevibacter gottschalkii DSM 11977]
MTRQEKIIKTSVIGIVVNLILVAFKATIGMLVNSIAITLDAVNNLTDALSSIITIIGTKLAGKAPDKNHPYGYGRVEYFASVIIAAIVLWAGITAFMESWPKILNPDATSYTAVSLVIIAVAVLVKFALGKYVKNVGEDINSQALVASGSDAFFDAVLSLSTLIAAVISVFFHVSLEGILGVVISIVIIKASVDMLRETIDSMIGSRVDSELSRKLKEYICEIPEVYGAYDLSLHNYGPEDMRGSVHIEVDDDLTAFDIHSLTRNIVYKVYDEFSIVLTIGIYARNNDYKDVREDLYNIASKYEEIIEIHGFIVNKDEDYATFDIIVDFDADREKVKERIYSEIKSKHPELDYYIIDDYDISD